VTTDLPLYRECVDAERSIQVSGHLGVRAADHHQAAAPVEKSDDVGNSPLFDLAEAASLVLREAPATPETSHVGRIERLTVTELARPPRSLAGDLHAVLGCQSVDLGECPARVLGEPSGVVELHGPGLASVVATRFDTLLVSNVRANQWNPLFCVSQG
jgi:hypothetical protein